MINFRAELVAMAEIGGTGKSGAAADHASWALQEPNFDTRGRSDTPFMAHRDAACSQSDGSR